MANEANDGGKIDLEFSKEKLEKLPEPIRRVVQEEWYIHDSEVDSEIESIKDGECVGCGRPFGDDTTLHLGPEGIEYITCSGACMIDLYVLGFLTEVAKDRIDALQHRGEINDSP